MRIDVVRQRAADGADQPAQQVAEAEFVGSVVGQLGQRERAEQRDLGQVEQVDDLHRDQRPRDHREWHRRGGDVAPPEPSHPNEPDERKQQKQRRWNVADRVGVQCQRAGQPGQRIPQRPFALHRTDHRIQKDRRHAEHQIAVQPEPRRHRKVGADQIEQAERKPCLRVLFAHDLVPDERAEGHRQQTERRRGQAQNRRRGRARQRDQPRGEPRVHRALTAAVVGQVHRERLQIPVDAVVGHAPCVVRHAGLVDVQPGRQLAQREQVDRDEQQEQNDGEKPVVGEQSLHVKLPFGGRFGGRNRRDAVPLPFQGRFCGRILAGRWGSSLSWALRKWESSGKPAFVLSVGGFRGGASFPPFSKAL